MLQIYRKKPLTIQNLTFGDIYKPLMINDVVHLRVLIIGPVYV